MKKSLKLRAVVSPTPAIIAAAYDENGKADACTLAFYTPSSHKPPCLTIAINATAKRKTLKSILHSGAFTVGYPSIEQVAEADWIGMASGYEHDKIAEVGWTNVKAEKVNAPVINELKLTIECKVLNSSTWVAVVEERVTPVTCGHGETLPRLIVLTVYGLVPFIVSFTI